MNYPACWGCFLCHSAHMRTSDRACPISLVPMAAPGPMISPRLSGPRSGIDDLPDEDAGRWHAELRRSCGYGLLHAGRLPGADPGGPGATQGDPWRPPSGQAFQPCLIPTSRHTITRRCCRSPNWNFFIAPRMAPSWSSARTKPRCLRRAPSMRLTHHRHEGMRIGVGCMAASAVDTSTKPRTGAIVAIVR